MLCTPLGEDHIDLTREAACEGMVLLKNEGLLPFAKAQRIAVFAPLTEYYYHYVQPQQCRQDPGALMAWQLSMVGRQAMVDILFGDANPSGHLTGTFAVEFDAYPSSENFNESNLYVEYQEDIFVGHHYFETIPAAAQKVCCPIGWGRSR